MLIEPVQRGFFCDDTSIQYPFRQDTIPMWLLAIYGGAGPIIIVSHLKIVHTISIEIFVIVLHR